MFFSSGLIPVLVSVFRLTFSDTRLFFYLLDEDLSSPFMRATASWPVDFVFIPFLFCFGLAAAFCFLLIVVSTNFRVNFSILPIFSSFTSSSQSVGEASVSPFLSSVRPFDRSFPFF